MAAGMRRSPGLCMSGMLGFSVIMRHGCMQTMPVGVGEDSRRRRQASESVWVEIMAYSLESAWASALASELA